MRRLIELGPAILEDEPALGALIARELAEHGAVELSLLRGPAFGFVAGISRTVEEWSDVLQRELPHVFEPGLSYAEAQRRAYLLAETLAPELARREAER